MVAAPFDHVVSPQSTLGIAAFMPMDRFMVLSPLGMLAFSAIVAPRLQLYINLVCKDVDAGQWGPENGGAAPGTWSVGPTRPVPCAADPLVQAKVAKLLTSPFYSILPSPSPYVLRNPY